MLMVCLPEEQFEKHRGSCVLNKKILDCLKFLSLLNFPSCVIIFFDL